MTIPNFDLQINGCFGVDFNSDDLTAEQLREVCLQLYARGTRQFLATIITADLRVMLARIQRLVDAIKAVEAEPLAAPFAKCIGLHIEGPFISNEPGYVGAHPIPFAVNGSLIAAKQLLHGSQGYLKLITLAPERDPKGIVTQFFAEQGVIVSAGHTNASLEQLRTCIKSGMNMITHFGNACPTTIPRHDNILWRMLSLDADLFVGIIADRHHLPLWLIPMLVKHFGSHRVICVSDAMSASGLGPGSFQLGDRTVQIGDDLVARDPLHGNFLGATSLLDQCEENLRDLNLFADSELESFLFKNAYNLTSRHQRNVS